ncbi:MAG: winged helix-turn-helix domain-containing protein [Pseudomonadota bacterium]
MEIAGDLPRVGYDCAMGWTFEDFELDDQQFELRRNGSVLAAEPQVIALLILLVQNRDRLLTKDEIVDQVWDGRIVSDSALSSRIKSARQLIGDDGKQQRFIKTVHGRGFRFVAAVEEIDTPAQNAPISAAPRSGVGGDAPTAPRRPSIAVLPFRLVGAAGPYAAIEHALPGDLITELSRLRWLFVIARETSFQMREQGAAPNDFHRQLNVRYGLCGSIEVVGNALTIHAELFDNDDGGVIWSELFTGSVDDIHTLRKEIVNHVVAALDVQIPQHEARTARADSQPAFEPWAAYHLGLDHAYRFTKADNEAARALFQNAIEAEPRFARAHAALAFTHTTDVTSQLSDDAFASIQAANKSIDHALAIDPRDPFANHTKGRAIWLMGDVDGAWHWAKQSVQLSPSYAHGHYGKAWPEMASSRTGEAIDSVDQAMRLSPLDPMMSAMCVVRAASHFIREEDEETAYWAQKAAIHPGSNWATYVLAAAFLEDAGKCDRAAHWAHKAAGDMPPVDPVSMLAIIRISDANAQDRFRDALTRHQFDLS